MSPATMRAVRYERFGPPDVLQVREVATPEPGAGEARVAVHAASVSGGERLIREGKVSLVMGKAFPAGAGVDFAGVVDALGAGASGGLQVGEAVWGVMPHRRFGALAEYVCVPEGRLARAPAGLTLVEAAALPAVGTTVVRALSREAGLKAGERTLIRGASGGVGSVAVPYAKSLGARVVALAGGHARSWLLQLGADEVFDYRATALADLGCFDVVLDAVGTQMGRLRRSLNAGGRMVELGFDPDHLLRSVAYIAATAVHGGRRIRAFSNDPSGAELAGLTALVQAGAIRPQVAKVWRLDEAAEAYRTLERGGVQGKFVVQLREP